METQKHKETAAALGLEWQTVREIYREMRAMAAAGIADRIEARRIAFAALGARNGGAFQLAHRHATTVGDRSNVKGLDDAARELAETELPELGRDDPSAALWELITTAPPAMPPADETMAAAIERAAGEKPAAPVSPDELLALPAAALIADVTEQWLRRLVAAGKVAGFRVGRHYLVPRAAAEAFRRHPTAGRPRREAAPF